MNKEYTEKHWEDEKNSNVFCGRHAPLGGCSLPCPQCKTLGFYGPRASKNSEGKITRKYRACKFCGFWQEAWGDVRNKNKIGGKPYRCIAVFCETCKRYDWQVPWASELKSCSTCLKKMKEIKWASDDPHHPFHTLEEQIIRAHNMV